MKTLRALILILPVLAPAFSQTTLDKKAVKKFKDSSNPHISKHAYILANSIWRDSPALYVYWENGSQSAADDMEVVRQAVKETWQKVSQLEFLGWQACASANAGIRIRIDDSGPSATKPQSSPTTTLPSGNRTLYNGFRFFGQSMYASAKDKISAWDAPDVEIGVANPAGERGLASFFIPFDAPPYTDPAASMHLIANAGIAEMPTSNIDEVAECPSSSYAIHYVAPKLDHVYCVRTRDGAHFAKSKLRQLHRTASLLTTCINLLRREDSIRSHVIVSPE